MDRSRQLRPDIGTKGYMIIAGLRVAGIVHFGSGILQALWHAFAAMSVLSMSSLEKEQEPGAARLSIGSCVRQACFDRKIDPLCVTQAHDFLPLLLILAILPMWWNPQLLPRYWRGAGMMTRLGEYYAFQPIYLAIRASAVYWLNPMRCALGGERLSAVHLFVAFSILAVSLVPMH